MCFFSSPIRRELSFNKLVILVFYRMENSVIVGTDIKSGSPRSKQRPAYSISVVKGDNVLFELEEAYIGDIIEVIRKYNAKILATDNIYELARDMKELREFVKRLPPDSKLVQVTGSPKGIRPLSSIAKEAGLPSPSHRDSLLTARIVAQLAQRGVGIEVVAMYPETRILITRNRSVKQGGSGNNRWRRSIEASILSEANKIATKLDDANMDYDLYVERASGGLRRAEFVVYSNISSVKKIVKESSEWAPLRVLVKQSWRSKLKFPSGQFSALPRSRPIIVGIDPGMSVGLAILDLSGDLLLLRTMRRASRSEIIEEILDHGYPIIIATDVNPPPKSVVKIASMFDSKLLVAKYEMKAEEKKKIVSEYEEEKEIRVESSHERDSLAAALKVYYKVKNLIARAKAKAEEAGLSKEIDDIVSMVLKGTSISKAIEEFLVEKEKIEEERKIGLSELKKELRRANKYIRKLNEKIGLMEKETERYKSLLREKEEEINRLIRKTESLEDRRDIEIEVDRRIASRDVRIRELEDLLSKERWRIELLKSQMRQLGEANQEIDGIKLMVLPSLSKDRLDPLYNISAGKVLLALDVTGASPNIVKKMNELGIKILLYRGDPPPKEFLDTAKKGGIMVAPAADYRIIWREIEPLIPTEDALDLISSMEEQRPNNENIERDIMNIIWNYRTTLMKREMESQDTK